MSPPASERAEQTTPHVAPQPRGADGAARHPYPRANHIPVEKFGFEGAARGHQRVLRAATTDFRLPIAEGEKTATEENEGKPSARRRRARPRRSRSHNYLGGNRLRKFLILPCIYGIDLTVMQKPES